ncbi:MAG: TRAP transporter large permease subunit [Burkholderiaceae bacterium]|nr:TRAP transporter large permease subunit [Burkholderiaceae bacterium]
MDLTHVTLIVMAGLMVLLASGLWIGYALMLTGAISIAIFTHAPVGQVVANTIWGNSADWTMTALPMFIWMGEILFRTRASDGIFNGLAPWLSKFPGRLMHTATVGCTLLGSVSGSSTATAATISKIVLPELSRRGYPEKPVIGMLAASGTLGILLPPSIIMIVYAVAAEVSILRLFMAGVVPGLLLASLFSGYAMIWSLLNPSKVPAENRQTTLREKLQASRGLMPIVALLVGVFAGMFSGIATATEIGALGVVGALMIAAFSGSLTWKSFWESAAGAMRLSCMIGLLVAGAMVFSTFMAYTGIPRELAEWISAAHLSPYVLVGTLTLIYLALGTVLEGVSMILLTTSITLPIVVAAGIDPIWFGIFIVIMTELAALTPPVGFNLSVMQVMTGRSSAYVTRAAMPFVFIMVFSVAVLTIFPEIVLWLPGVAMAK